MMARMQVAILGLGLMGGSLGLALARSTDAHIRGFDPDADAARVAYQHGCCHETADTLAAACVDAGFVFVCAPVAALPTTVADALAATTEATVTDIGSTKARLVGSVNHHHRHRFVGGHPMVGSEARGASAARGELFEGATYFLTPVDDTDTNRYAALHSLLGRIGARPVAISPRAHDRLVAVTSHLPHVVANLLATQAGAGRVDGHDPLTSVGGSFRDMTRVAGANPRVWVDIFLDNREQLAAALREHRRRLDEVLGALDTGDAGFLNRWVGDAAAARRQTLEAAYPGQSGDLHRLRIHLPDRPGAISAIAQAFGAARINIDDIELHHLSPERGGIVDVLVAGADTATRAIAILDEHGYAAIGEPVVDRGQAS
jgi:prephenate dehydrogenase